MTEPGNIFLIGYRGCGKTTVAYELGEKLGWEWVDADSVVEQWAGKSIAAVFEEDGESAFRDLESQVLDDLVQRQQTVIALGGGAVLRQVNRDTIAGHGIVVWLTATVETLLQRVENDPATASRRPDLTTSGGRSEFEVLLAERTPIYQACATFAVDTEGKTPADVADEIVTRLGNSQ